MPRVAKGHIEQLPSGSFRVYVYAGTDPLTKRQIQFKSTVKTEQQAHIELGRLLKEASEGRTPESDATVAELMDEYAAVRVGQAVHHHPPAHPGYLAGRRRQGDRPGPRARRRPGAGPLTLDGQPRGHE
jgi:hypothetical protein